MTENLLSTVRITVEPPDEQDGAVIEVAVTSRSHAAYLINAVAVAADTALRATANDHPHHVVVNAQDIAPRVYMRDSRTITVEADGLPDGGLLVLPGHGPDGGTVTAEPLTHVVDDSKRSHTLCGLKLAELTGLNTATEMYGVVLPSRVNCAACRSAA